MVHTHKFEASLIYMPVPCQSENSKSCLENKTTAKGTGVREAGAGREHSAGIEHWVPLGPTGWLCIAAGTTESWKNGIPGNRYVELEVSN